MAEDTEILLEQLLNAIPVGAKNAKTSIELRTELGISDRKLRELISFARHDTCIINFQNNKGYFKPENVEEAEKWIAQEEHRAKSIFWSMKGARDFVKGGEQCAF